MRNQPGWTNGGAFRPEGLEARGLLAVGVLSGLNVVEELGSVSRASAIRGVEVTAPIAPNGSVTFRFEAEASGPYTLKVLYKGDGLGLLAEGPSGRAAIPAGTPGSFETLSLPLDAGSYAITASALGDRPAFVDWELLLNTGVGQGAAQAAALVSSSPAIPLPSTAGTTLLTPSSSPGAPTSTSAPSANPAPAFSLASSVASGPVGRAESTRPISPVGPTTSDGSTSVAYAGDGLPDGILASISVPVEAETAPRPSMLAALDVIDADQDREALAVTSWFERFAAARIPQAPTPSGAPKSGGVGDEADPDAVVARVESKDSESGHLEECGNAPELIAGAVVVAAVSRRWVSKLKAIAKRPGFPTMTAGWPLSMR